MPGAYAALGTEMFGGIETIDRSIRLDRSDTECPQEMQRYGIFPADLPDGAPIDVYATDQAYWESLWPR